MLLARIGQRSTGVQSRDLVPRGVPDAYRSGHGLGPEDLRT